MKIGRSCMDEEMEMKRRGVGIICTASAMSVKSVMV